MKYKNVLFGKLFTVTENKVLYEDIILPKKSLPLLYDFNESKVVGIAKNFNKKDYNIYCDVEVKDKEYIKAIKNKFLDTLSFGGLAREVKLSRNKKYTIVEELKLDKISIVNHASLRELEGNLK